MSRRAEMRALVGRDMFERVTACWVCAGTNFRRFHELRFDLRQYVDQDPELHAYTGQRAWLVRCGTCGFAQPEVMPTLPAYFDRLYDQQWSEEWIAREFEATYKDLIFQRILTELRARARGQTGRLLDIGAHVGRFIHLAQRAGWSVEGIELNPRTADYAARRTGATVHRINAHALSARGERYAAVTLTDVLEHIPEPVSLLTSVAPLVEPGGWIAVKVPCGISQWWKERVLAALRPGRRVCIGENLVHVNHFAPGSLTEALTRAGFDHVTVRTAPPELFPLEALRPRLVAANSLRLAVYAAARLPGAVHTPLGLHLQAFAQKPLHAVMPPRVVEARS